MILLSPIVYLATKFVPATAGMNFLNQMAVTFWVLWAVMLVLNFACPRKEDYVLEAKGTMDMTQSKGAAICGAVVVLVTIALYILFW